MNSKNPEIPSENQNRTPVVDASQVLSDLVDVLIPGDEGWPSGSSVGVHGVLAMRISETMSKDGLSELVGAILSAGGPFEGRSEDDRIAVVNLFSAQEPKLFEWIYAAAVLAYYEQPSVIKAIQALGRPYSMRPHLTGYPLVPFDHDKDRPLHGRGFFLPTDSVQPVDVSQLRLDEIRTEHWGVTR
jgi:hypothetical protein